MTPLEFAPAVEQCDRVIASAREAMAYVEEHPRVAHDEAPREAVLLSLDVVAVIGAAQRMLRRPFVDGRGAVLRRIVEAGVIACSETAAAIGLWSPAVLQWQQLARECEQCRDALRNVLSREVHDAEGMSGAT